MAQGRRRNTTLLLCRHPGRRCRRNPMTPALGPPWAGLALGTAPEMVICEPKRKR